MRTLFSAFLLLWSIGIQAQSIDGHAFVAGGQTFSFTGGTMEVVVGEFAVTTLSTSSIYLTQGLLQPEGTYGTNIQGIISESQVRLFPNPVSENLFIETTIPNELEAKIWDSAGRIVLKFRFHQTEQVDVSHLAEGVYILTLTEGQKNSQFSYRFVKN